MKKDGLFSSILNAVISEEKKKYVGKPMDYMEDIKKQHWYRIMDFIDNLEEPQDAPGDPKT